MNPATQYAYAVSRCRPSRRDRAQLLCASRMASGIARIARNAQLSPIIIPSGHTRHEPDPTVRALQAWPDHLAEPPRDGAADPQPRGAARHGAEPAGDRLLRAARLRRPPDHRSQSSLAAGPGLSGYARHLFEGAGRKLAQGHGPRARKG